jgi:hypothetical protein
MAGSGFHVHGPHDHELEQAKFGDAHDEEGNSMMGQIALFTAVIATVGAIFGYNQSKSTKQNLSELALELSPGTKKDFYETEIKRYKEEKAEIKVNAEKLEALSQEWDQKSDEQMHQHHRWAQATTTLQVAIALAAIALLTRKRWLRTCMYIVGVLGVGVGALAVAHI